MPSMSFLESLCMLVHYGGDLHCGVSRAQISFSQSEAVTLYHIAVLLLTQLP